MAVHNLKRRYEMTLCPMPKPEKHKKLLEKFDQLMKIEQVIECGVTFRDNHNGKGYVNTYRVTWKDTEISQSEAALFVEKNYYTRVKVVQKLIIKGKVKYRISWDETLDWEESVNKHMIGKKFIKKMQENESN